MTEKKILILGVGNPLLGDEGVGIHVVRELEKRTFPPSVTVLDGGTGGYELIRFLSGMDKVIIIDAVKGDVAPGTLLRLQPEEVEAPRRERSLSVHQDGLSALLQGVKRMKPRPDIMILGISIRHSGAYCLELSRKIKRILPKVIDLIRKEVVDAGSEG